MKIKKLVIVGINLAVALNFSGSNVFAQEGGLSGEQYSGPTYSLETNLVCDPGWLVAQNNDRLYCAITQEKCSKDRPGTVLTKDALGYAVCWFPGEKLKENGGPSQEEIDAEVSNRQNGGPSTEEMKQFEKEFGGPPESFASPSIQKPTFEQPGTVSEEVKKYVSDKDLVAVYCAMTKWRSGDFFSAMDAVKKYVIGPSQQIKSDFGIDFEIPDIDALKAEGAKRTEGICNASALD